MRNVEYELSKLEFDCLVDSLSEVDNYNQIVTSYTSCILYMLMNDMECLSMNQETHRNLRNKIVKLQCDVLEELNNR